MNVFPEAGDIADSSISWPNFAIRTGGCPWDLEQSFETIAPYTIEEAYEVVDAIENGDMRRLRDELGICSFKSFSTPRCHAKRAASISTASWPESATR